MKQILIWMLIVANVVLWFSIIWTNFAHIMPYIEPERTIKLRYEPVDYSHFTKAELRTRIENVINIHCYFYSEQDLPAGYAGKTIILLRTIKMRKTLTNEEYILAFAHELCHLKGWSSNERYTSYLTFIKLYNSEFKDIALKFAIDMNNGRYPFEYNCYGQIEKYLIRRNYE